MSWSGDDHDAFTLHHPSRLRYPRGRQQEPPSSIRCPIGGIMIRTIPVTVVLAVVLLLSACGKASLGPAGIQGESSIATVRDLTSAYERRDIDGFMAKVSSAFPNRPAFQQSIEKVFSEY